MIFAQINDKLQIHFMDVGQGDGAVLISPQGQIVLFDQGVLNNCTKPLNYLQQLGITKIDYLVVSHYYADHIGCTDAILQRYPLLGYALDRGGSYPSATFQRYVNAVGAQRSEASPGTSIVLDGPTNPVTITVLALNGNGIDTADENSLSLVALVSYGAFRAEIGGDLVGVDNRGARDIETSVGPLVGPVDVYNAHHHCSRYSSNDAWLSTTKPTIAILSLGDGNPYGLPHQECVDRLHNNGVMTTYWTETGAGASPQPGLDVVAGNIVIETTIPDVGVQLFTVTTTSGGTTETYVVRGPGPADQPEGSAFLCSFVWCNDSIFWPHSLLAKTAFRWQAALSISIAWLPTHISSDHPQSPPMMPPCVLGWNQLPARLATD